MSSQSKLFGKFLVGLGLVFGLLCYGKLAQADTFNVPSLDYPIIQSAIDAASDLDIVLVDDGIYTENINFYGKKITVQSVNGAESTIIDGNAGLSVVTFSLGEDADSILDGFTITNGGGSSNGTSIYGGGIYCKNSSPIIINCIISGNSVIGYLVAGGGIYCEQFSSPTIINCAIRNNSANGTYSGRGGGIYYHDSSPTIINSVISSNTASNDGGGIYCNNSLAVITNCTISSNTASNDGGGIYCYNASSPKIVNSILWGDSAGGSPTEIYVAPDSSITVTYSDIDMGNPLSPPYNGTGNINANPLFVGDGDYHLTATSPCIDTGTGDTATYPTLPTDDIDGDTRPYDGKPGTQSDDGFEYDMGADECVDEDGDGVYDYRDNCLGTPLDEVVDPNTGCSIAQICPCDGPPDTTSPWKNHGKYVSCVAKTSSCFVSLGLITGEEKGAIVSEAADSDCGHENK